MCSGLKVGIPRGLYYYKFGPLWNEFLLKLGCEVVFSQPTSAQIVEEGAKDALSELCVPMKIYFGHIRALIREFPELDYIFIPRYVSSHKEQFFCPKFLVLPEAVIHGMNVSVPILTLNVNAKEMSGIEGALELGKKLGVGEENTGKAWILAKKKYKEFQDQISASTYIQMLHAIDPNPAHVQTAKIFKQVMPNDLRGKFPLNILILGHPYNVYENHINMDLIGRLEAWDCKITTIEALENTENFQKPITINKQYHQYWQGEDEILKAARYYLLEGRDEIDGVIFLISFACGPDSLIEEIVMRDMKVVGIPFLALILDEHSGESGLVTRIESFIDMIRREKYRHK